MAATLAGSLVADGTFLRRESLSAIETGGALGGGGAAADKYWDSCADGLVGTGRLTGPLVSVLGVPGVVWMLACDCKEATARGNGCGSRCGPGCCAAFAVCDAALLEGLGRIEALGCAVFGLADVVAGKWLLRGWRLMAAARYC